MLRRCGGRGFDVRVPRLVVGGRAVAGHRAEAVMMSCALRREARRGVV